jgi:cysteinyl-tRNA synthetase
MRTVRLHDTYSGALKELRPRDGRKVGIYACGPTVYGRIHVGNARPFVVFSLLARFLAHEGYEPTLVANITDINDKIYEAAARQKMGSAELAEQAAQWYIDDTGELGLGRPDVEPRATEVIPEIVALIGELIDRGLAYESGGDVYFRVPAYPTYGELSGAQPDDMLAQDPSDLKEDARDFALWKSTKAHEDTEWESPWGPGRPGWHIECSAMAEKHLGPEFEIHGGGLDLRFPHHENELAQSRGAGRPFARFWAHNGMLQLSEEKMSKSVGNIVSLREVLDTYGREAILVFFLSGHYRSPLDYSDEAMRSAIAQVETFRNAFIEPPPKREARDWQAFVAALEDDFNTPEALALMHEWRAAGQLDWLSGALGIFGLRSLYGGFEEAPRELTELAIQRFEARARGDFDEADRLRETVEAAGWEIRDYENGFRLIPRQ